MIQNISTRNVGMAMEAADHNFTVKTVPLMLPDGQECPTHVATVREDTGAFLGAVGRGYQVVQPRSFYELAHGMIAEIPGATIDKALTMKGGAVMGLSIHIDTREFLPGDPTQLDMVMMTSFNSDKPLMGRAISHRWICTNQLPSSTALFTMKHTRFVEHRLDTALKMLGFYAKELDTFDNQMRRLTKARFGDDRAVEWFGSLLPKAKTERSQSIVSNQTASFVNLLHHGKGTEIPGVRGSAYGALNALTEYVNHERPTRVKEGRDAEEVRYEAVNFGSGDVLMQRGKKALLDVIDI